ncbi:helix-turn-helix domain-containing protein [Nonomuraea sp. bgisy101]|uniref:helix-turn-helix domain-containing protein n=1 Tax=Nonomuraea sp. bgisy101 TaxID=3413784 RepID=UPI003D70F7AB
MTSTTERVSPPLRLMRLGRTLHRLREERGLTGDQVCAKTGWSPSTLSRLERGKTAHVLPGDVHVLLNVYAAEKSVRDECISLAVSARVTPYWAEHKKALGGLVEYVALETEAESISSWQPQVIPGLLQTEEYARTVLEASQVEADGAMVRLRVRARIARQWILHCAEPAHLQAVVSEEALRREVGGRDIMRGQLDHLLAELELPNIEIRVLPRAVAVHPGMDGGFVLLTLPAMGETLYLEAGHDGILDQGPRASHFRRRYSAIQELAWEPGPSAAFIGRVREEMA